MADKFDGVKITGLWKSPNGKSISGPCYSQHFEIIDAAVADGMNRFLILPNNFKTEDKHPDYTLFIAPSNEKREAAKPKPKRDDSFGPDDDLPF